MTQLTSKSQLQDLLTVNNIDNTNWGQGSTNSLENLWQEIQDGDSILTGNPLYRSINFVQIIIRQNENILIETDQELANGTTRSRNRPPSEKMQTGETVEMAALRGLKQELGLTAEQMFITHIFDQSETVKQTSESYPGLMTSYTIFTAEADVAGLPDIDFSSIEQSPTDPVRKHFWKWLPEETALMLIKI